jgi:hypothetical protein
LYQSIERGVAWLIEHTRQGTHFPASPIGFYFAKLWYWERLYPLVWTVSALGMASRALRGEVAPTAAHVVEAQGSGGGGS